MMPFLKHFHIPIANLSQQGSKIWEIDVRFRKRIQKDQECCTVRSRRASGGMPSSWACTLAASKSLMAFRSAPVPSNSPARLPHSPRMAFWAAGMVSTWPYPKKQPRGLRACDSSGASGPPGGLSTFREKVFETRKMGGGILCCDEKRFVAEKGINEANHALSTRGLQPFRKETPNADNLLHG